MKQSAEEKPSLLVAGVHRASEGYPNVLYRLEMLRTSGRFEFSEINVPLWRNDAGPGSFLRLPRLAVRLVAAHLKLLFRLLRAPPADIVYIPYPGIFVLNLLPRRMRRRAHVVLDAFISIYDTAVCDRQLLAPTDLLARLLRWVERRAYNRADLVIVDTPENASFVRSTFELDPSRVVDIPLSTNERDYAPAEYDPVGQQIRVLFIGTFVPLHGAETIVKAAQALRHRNDIEFRLIGDGQDAKAIEQLLSCCPAKVTWLRDWHSPGELAEEIRQADICLGIFSQSAKAQRVCPLKIYMYAAIGRPIITADTEWVRSATRHVSISPFALVEAGNALALAKRIAELAESEELRRSLASASREFYYEYMANCRANEQSLSHLQRGLMT
jgi:glycosyltransferase involved in cell wall biosynthesis